VAKRRQKASIAALNPRPDNLRLGSRQGRGGMRFSETDGQSIAVRKAIEEGWTMNLPPVESRDEWVVACRELLVRGRELARHTLG
jgi:hypothetical protein